MPTTTTTSTPDLLPVHPRPLRDLPALLLSLSTIALGFVAIARRNPAASHASSFVFDAASFSYVLPSSNLLSLSLSPSSSTQPLLSSTDPSALPLDANDDDDQYPRSPTSTTSAPSVISPPSSSPSRPSPLASSLSPAATLPPPAPPPSSSTLPPFPVSCPPPTSSPSPFPLSLPSDHRLPTSPSPLPLLPRNPRPQGSRGDPYF